MRAASTGLIIAALFAGCLEPSEPAQVSTDPCAGPSKNLKAAVDTLYVHANRTYSVLVHEHGQGWGLLRLVTCGEMVVFVRPSTPKTALESEFSFVYLFAGDPSPSSAPAIVDRWGSMGYGRNECNMPTSSPGYAPPVRAGIIPISSVWTLIAAGQGTHQVLNITTGTRQRDDDSPVKIQWNLGPHPALTVEELAAKDVAAAGDPLTRAREWRHKFHAGTDAVLNLGWWLERPASLSAGEYRDVVKMRIGKDHVDSSKSEPFACGPTRQSSSAYLVSLPASTGDAVLIERDYQERAILPGASIQGMRLLTVPLGPPS